MFIILQRSASFPYTYHRFLWLEAEKYGKFRLLIEPMVLMACRDYLVYIIQEYSGRLLLYWVSKFRLSGVANKVER